MSRNVEEAKQRRNEKLRQTRSRQSLKLLAAAVALIVIAVGGYALFNSDLWLIKSITVVGNHRLTSKQVVDLAGVDYKTSLLRLPAADITANLKKNPWISDVQLSRALPNRLTIQIKERQPFVGLKQGDEVLVLDKTGFVVQSTGTFTTETAMPVISDIKIGRLKVGERGKGAALTGALKSLSVLAPEIRAKTTWISVLSLEKLTFQTADGLEIVFGGPEDAAKKNFVIKKILKDSSGKIVHINVTAPDNPVVRKLEQ